MMSTSSQGVMRPLAEIPKKEGFVLIGVRSDFSEARLRVYVDEDGRLRVPEFEQLIGWRYP